MASAVSRLDPRQLAAVLAVVRHGSFKRAAQALGISQPALSKTVSLLERRIGRKVFERSAHGVTLTELGKIVARRAEQLDLVLEKTQHEVTVYSHHREGPLVIGAIPSTMLGWAPGALARLTLSHPNLVATLIEGLDDELTRALERGAIDLLVGPVMGLRPAPADLSETKIADDPFFVLLPPQHRLAGARQVRLRDLADERWILPSPGSSFCRSVEALFLAAGVPWPRDHIASNSPHAIARLARSTQRVTIATRIELLEQPKDFRPIRLYGAPPRALGIKHRKDYTLSQIEVAFVEHLRKVAIDLKIASAPAS